MFGQRLASYLRYTVVRLIRYFIRVKLISSIFKFNLAVSENNISVSVPCTGRSSFWLTL